MSDAEAERLEQSMFRERIQRPYADRGERYYLLPDDDKKDKEKDQR